MTAACADMFTTKKRSEIMSRIRSRGNRSTELTLLLHFRECKITSWRRHAKLPGTPDFVFRTARLCVFVDGCFWHGCTRCYCAPRTQKAYWAKKIRTNRARDRRVSRALRQQGWSVMRIRECTLAKQPGRVLVRLRAMLTGVRPAKTQKPNAQAAAQQRPEAAQSRPASAAASRSAGAAFGYN